MSWDDQPLPEDAEIKAAFPTRSGRHDVYQEAMRLVGACHSKGRLLELVNWLLIEREAERARAVRICRYWAECNRDAFPEQAMAADACAGAIEDPKRNGGLGEASPSSGKDSGGG